MWRDATITACRETRQLLGLLAEDFVGIYDVFDDGVADDVGWGEVDEGDAGDVLEGVFCFVEAGGDGVFQVDL